MGAFVRELAASFVFATAAAIWARESEWPWREHAGRVAICGASMFGNVFLNLVALAFTTPLQVALLQPTQPIFATCIAACQGQERLTSLKLLGIVLSCAGSFVMAFQTSQTSGTAVPSGPTFNFVNCGSGIVLLQCACGGNYVVQQWPLTQAGYPPVVIASSAYFVATALTVLVGIIYLPLMSSEERATSFSLEATPGFAVALAYVVVLTTVYNYTVMAWSTGKLGAPLVTLFLLLQGVFACVFQLVIFGSTIELAQALGGVGICLGLAALVYSKHLDAAAYGIGSVAVEESDSASTSCSSERLRSLED